MDPIPKQEKINKENIETAERIVRDLEPVIDVLARSGVNLRLTRKGPETSLYFDPETEECVINLDFLIDRKLTDVYEVLFGCAHEAGHLIQALEDIEGFEMIEKLAEEKSIEISKKILQNPELKNKIINHLKTNLPEEKRNLSEEEILKYVFRKIYHKLNNCVLDVNDNASIIRRMVPFQEGQPRGDVIKKVYQKKLFPAETESGLPNYQNMPYYAQFAYSLIRNYMTNERAVVSEAVKDCLERKTSVYGQKINMEQLIKEYVAAPRTKSFDLFVYLKQFIIPVFDELLWEDIKNGRIKIEISDNDFHGKEGTEFHGEMIEKIKGWKKNKQKSAKDRQKDLAKKQFEQAGKKNNFSEKEIQELWDIEQKNREIIEILKNVWYSFLRKESILYLEKQGAFRFGNSLQISEVIRQIFIQKKPSQEAEVMEKYITKEEIILLPKKIKIVLILDLSGSMDEQKRKTVQEVSYSILNSLLRFSDELKINLELPDFPIDVDFKIIGFGDKTIELPKDKRSDDKITIINRAVLNISRIDLGSTQDDVALKTARDFFSTDDISEIKENKTLGIVLEITDGETDTPNTSKNEVKKINEAGVFCKGIQIPGQVYDEKKPEKPEEAVKDIEKRKIIPPTETFKEVWGENGLQIKNISQLPDIVIELLKEAVNKSLL